MLELELRVPPPFRPMGVGLEFRVIVRVGVVGLLLELEFRVIVGVRI